MDDDFIQSQGLIWLPHILRRLADRFVQASEAVFPDYGIVVPPRSVSTMHLLYAQGPQAVTDIAAAIGHSHPSVIQWIKQLKALALVESGADAQDRRRTLISLTPAGVDQAQRLIAARTSFEAAYRRLMNEAGVQLFDELWRVEESLKAQPFDKRIQAELRQERHPTG